MSRKVVRSAKGVLIDFDLLKIKEQIASDPAPLDVKARQDHVDQRMRRRLRKVKKTAIAPIIVEPNLPVAERAEQPEPLIDEIVEKVAPKKTKQKARSKTKSNQQE